MTMIPGKSGIGSVRAAARASDDVIVAPGVRVAGLKRPPKGPPDKAREELVRILAIRGKPINRRRGMAPSAEFSRAAGEYIVAHHYNFCVQFARGRAARHIELADLVNACMTGAYMALERFDIDHPEAYRFLSYAKWYMLCETNRLLHREECLVVVPAAVKEARAKLARACPNDVSDEEAAELLGIQVDDVKSARGAHLGHEHRPVSEANKTTRRSLDSLRVDHEARSAELRSHAHLESALAQLDPLMRGVLFREYGVGVDEGAPEPQTDAARRAIRHMALRKLRDLLTEDEE